jgi:hypothetical protein
MIAGVVQEASAHVSPEPGQIRLAHVAIIQKRAADWYAQDVTNQLTLLSAFLKSEAWNIARQAGRSAILERDPQGLEALEDSWIAWTDDIDRMPTDFMTTGGGLNHRRAYLPSNRLSLIVGVLECWSVAFVLVLGTLPPAPTSRYFSPAHARAWHRSILSGFSSDPRNG